LLAQFVPAQIAFQETAHPIHVLGLAQKLAVIAVDLRRPFEILAIVINDHRFAFTAARTPPGCCRTANSAGR
jgi:hypothetical protein